MKLDLNSARFYIGKVVPLPSAPFPIHCSHPSVFSGWTCKLQNISGLFFFSEYSPPSAALDPRCSAAWVVAAGSILPSGAIAATLSHNSVLFWGLSGSWVPTGVCFVAC